MASVNKLATRACSHARPHTRIAAYFHTDINKSSSTSSLAKARQEYMKEREGLLSSSEIAQMKSAEKNDGSFTWWAPHPSTGVWAPEGHTTTGAYSPLLADTTPWFRDDVHAECHV